MKSIIAQTASVMAIAVLSACGGGSTGGGTLSYAQQLSGLNARLVDNRLTPERDLPTGSATYRGIANFNLSNGSDADFNAAASGNLAALPAYLGALRLDVNFANDTFSGNITNFTNYAEQRKPGQITISNGVLTGRNAAGIGDGLTAVATGAIDGRALTMDVRGNFTGTRGQGAALYFDDRTSLAGGVGLAAR